MSESCEFRKSLIEFLHCLHFAIVNSEYTSVILKPKQVTCLESSYLGKDLLAVLPTGYGKSLVYHVLYSYDVNSPPKFMFYILTCSLCIWHCFVRSTFNILYSKFKFCLNAFYLLICSLPERHCLYSLLKFQFDIQACVFFIQPQSSKKFRSWAQHLPSLSP